MKLFNLHLLLSLIFFNFFIDGSERLFVPDANSILKHHSLSESSLFPSHGEAVEKKHIQGRSLGYLTPWNRKGHNISRSFHHKFTYISPVWYNIKPASTSSSKAFTVEGQNDVHQEWLKDMQAHTQVQVIPRFNLMDFEQTHFMKLFRDVQYQNELIEEVIRECSTWKYNGIVFESPINMYLSEFFKKFTNRLNKNKMILIITLHPVRPSAVPPEMNRPEYWKELLDATDGVSLMTYDYSSSNPGPNSPLYWINDILDMMFPGSRDKVFVGMNMYGNDYSSSGVESITGSKYIDILEKYSVSFVLHPKDEEYEMIYVDEKNTRHQVWYPTLKTMQTRIKYINEIQSAASFWEIGQGLDYFVE